MGLHCLLRRRCLDGAERRSDVPAAAGADLAATDGEREVRLIYYAFDLLHLDGWAVLSLSLIERKGHRHVNRGWAKEE